MAGGSGTRLWPASSSGKPKQFLSAGSGSFFSLALERSLAAGERVIIITSESHLIHVIEQTAELKAADRKRVMVITEPAAKNTAPAIACAAMYSHLGGPKRNMLVLTSDHIIKPLETFKADAALAADAANAGKLAVFGIPPVRAETGYGYIETEKKSGANGIFNVTAFHEKPDLKTAKKYAAAYSGTSRANRIFFWNSGMFAFCSEFILQQFNSLAPDVYRCFSGLKEPKAEEYTITGIKGQKGIKVLSGWNGLKNAYKKVKSISFDYAIAEKCRESVMIRANFDWIDIGNWEEYAKICSNSNSQVFIRDSEGCFVDSDIPVALAGVEDLIVVIRSGKDGSPAAALVTKKGQTQKIRDIVSQVKDCGRTDLL
jgi:mannose-1-phosphate guanylyltransferase/mannose-1-phosphate guanylyltransferase/mannose-6-phosphate isomerase